MECIENIIGITNETCPCVTDGLTTDQIAELKVSASGLYLSENLEGGISLKEIKSFSACAEYFDLAKRAVKAAKKKFEDDILIAMLEKYKSSQPTYKGDLGRLQYVTNLTVNDNVQYLKITPRKNVSATMKIHGVRLVLDQAVTTPVKLIAVERGLNYGEEIFSVDVDTLENRFVNVDIPINIEVPFIKDGKTFDYYVTWEKSGDARPKDNGVSCGCAGGDAFDPYVEISGGEVYDYDQLGTATPQTNARGIIVFVEIACSVGKFVCNEYDERNDIAKISAWANLYKAGELLIEYVKQSPEINRLTTMQSDYLWGKRNHFRKEYNTCIEFLAEKIDARNSDCFICNDSNARMSVGNVFGEN